MNINKNVKENDTTSIYIGILFILFILFIAMSLFSPKKWTKKQINELEDFIDLLSKKNWTKPPINETCLSPKVIYKCPDNTHVCAYPCSEWGKLCNESPTGPNIQQYITEGKKKSCTVSYITKNHSYKNFVKYKNILFDKHGNNHKQQDKALLFFIIILNKMIKCENYQRWTIQCKNILDNFLPNLLTNCTNRNNFQCVNDKIMDKYTGPSFMYNILFSHKLDNLNKFIIDLQNISSCSCEIDSSVNIIKYIKSYRNLIINLIKSI